MGRLFGTDGVRGRANADLTPELALSVARAAASVLADRDGTSRPVAVVGRDPRASGEMLEAAVVAGLASAGAEVLRVGVLPTPAIAHLTGRTEADLGVMISASHNPMPDNGIKLFSRGGHKLPDAVEAAIELRIAGRDGVDHRPTGGGIGRVRDLAGAAEDYTAHVLSALARAAARAARRRRLRARRGLAVAPEVYRRAGRQVHVIGGEPDGWNINDGIGSTHLGPLIEAVARHGADIGIAHDGDADRCLAVTADGDVVDGDAILAICALALHERGNLTDDTVVATVMSNLGFHHTMRQAGIAVETTAVGDRYVLEALHARGPVPRWRAERAPGLPGLGHHRRRPAHRPGPAVPDERRPAPRWPSSPPSCTGCRRPWSTCRSPTGSPSRRATRSPGRSTPSRPSSATRAGCCCAPRAPSSSSGSWSRPPPRSRPTPSRRRLAEVVAATRVTPSTPSCEARARPSGPPVSSVECAASWGTSDRRTPWTSSWRACAGWSTAATTPRASPSSPTGG